MGEHTLNKYPPRFVSGVQPTDEVHLGHYFGAIKQNIELQHEYPGQAFYFVADFHGLTERERADKTHIGTIELATIYLALGLDPNKAIFYRQSDVPECCELSWILSCLISKGRLELGHATKAKEKKGLDMSAALLFYPVLMAADIFTVRATKVPVGSDQIQHIEIARDLARQFNNRYNTDLIPVPEARINKHTQSVPGINGKKMSTAYKNHIGLFESYTHLKEKIFSITTDSKSENAPKEPKTCTIFKLYSLVAEPDKIQEMELQYINGKIGYKNAKQILLHTIKDFFQPYEERYFELKKQHDFVADVLREGFKQAKEEAQQTLMFVRHLVGLSS